MNDLTALSWPLSRAPEALHGLARHARFDPRPFVVHSALHGESSIDEANLDEHLASAAVEMDVEIEPVEVPYADAEALVRRAAPGLVRLDSAGGEARVLALAGSRGDSALVLAPDGSLRRVPIAEIRSAWCAGLEAALAPMLEPLLDAAGVRASRRERTRRALYAEHLGSALVSGAWLVRLPLGRPLVQHARREGLFGLAGGIIGVGAVASAIGIVAWIALGRGTLAGNFEPAWIAAWVLLLVSVLPLRICETWLQALFTIRAGAFVKRRLLRGAARLDPEDVRGEGAGRLFGRVLDAEALEALVFGAGFLAIGAAIDVGLAIWALANGPSPAATLGLFAFAVVGLAGLAVRFFRRDSAFATARLSLTHDLVERMIAHRTRIAVEPPQLWHVEEDRLLETYLASGRALDRASQLLVNVIDRFWLIGGVATIGLAFVRADASPTALAIGLGGVLLAQQALSKLASGAAQVASCAVAWHQVKPVFAAAAKRADPGLPRAALEPVPLRSRSPLLEARGIAYRYPSRVQPALADVDLVMQHGERVLVEGPSGGGKSTLASLLIGWRDVSSGLLLLDGLDRPSHGAANWRKHVSAAPQFHENHVFSGTLAFNAQLGIQRPRSIDDDQKTLSILRELGLGDLLERMPSGLQQVVGETGWQLSHGEKSRLYVARALLQEGRLCVLDESLAALDPENLRRVVQCVARRAPGWILIAHP